jgi:hypothetical protein
MIVLQGLIIPMFKLNSLNLVMPKTLFNPRKFRDNNDPLARFSAQGLVSLKPDPINLF